MIGEGTMEELHGLIEIALLLVGIVSAVATYLRFRGRQFGIADLLIFGTLATTADIFSCKLFLATAGSHADAAAYAALAALLALLCLVPIAAGLSMVAIVAMFVCLVRHPALRYGVVLLTIAAWLAGIFPGRMDNSANPGGVQNNDKLAGENWALESGAASKQDCDRQSQAAAFREGCYAQLRQ